MQHTLTVEAVRIKTQKFDPPAKLINGCELAAAIALGYRQAGIPIPEFRQGDDVRLARERFLADCAGAGQPLVQVVEGYQAGEGVFDADMLEVVRIIRNGGIG